MIDQQIAEQIITILQNEGICGLEKPENSELKIAAEHAIAKEEGRIPTEEESEILSHYARAQKIEEAIKQTLGNNPIKGMNLMTIQQIKNKATNSPITHNEQRLLIAYEKYSANLQQQKADDEENSDVTSEELDQPQQDEIFELTEEIISNPNHKELILKSLNSIISKYKSTNDVEKTLTQFKNDFAGEMLKNFAFGHKNNSKNLLQENLPVVMGLIKHYYNEKEKNAEKENDQKNNSSLLEEILSKFKIRTNINKPLEDFNKATNFISVFSHNPDIFSDIAFSNTIQTDLFKIVPANNARQECTNLCEHLDQGFYIKYILNNSYEKHISKKSRVLNFTEYLIRFIKNRIKRTAKIASFVILKTIHNPWGLFTTIGNFCAYMFFTPSFLNENANLIVNFYKNYQIIFFFPYILGIALASLITKTNQFCNISNMEKYTFSLNFISLAMAFLCEKSFPTFVPIIAAFMSANFFKIPICLSLVIIDSKYLKMNFYYSNGIKSVLEKVLWTVQLLLPVIFYCIPMKFIFTIALELVIPLFLSKDRIKFIVISNIVKYYADYKSLGPIIARASLETYVGNKHGIDNIDNKINQFTEGLIGKISEQNPSKETINIKLIKESNFSVRAKITHKIRNFFCKIKNGSAKSISHV